MVYFRPNHSTRCSCLTKLILPMKYSLLPSWVVTDTDISHAAVRTCAALCCFTSVNGIAYPSQNTLAALRGVSQPAISAQMNQLRKAGAVIDLEPVGRKHPDAFKRGNRYFVPLRPGDHPPPLEVIRTDILAPVRTPPDD